MIEKEKILEALKNVYDPEIPVDIVDLGLIYNIDMDQEKGLVSITMTLTAQGCPLGNYILHDVEMVTKSVDGVKNVKINLTYDPPWSPDMMSEEAKKNLGYE